MTMSGIQANSDHHHLFPPDAYTIGCYVLVTSIDTSHSFIVGVKGSWLGNRNKFCLLTIPSLNLFGRLGGIHVGCKVDCTIVIPTNQCDRIWLFSHSSLGMLFLISWAAGWGHYSISLCLVSQ